MLSAFAFTAAVLSAWTLIVFFVVRWTNRRIRAHEAAIGPDRVGMFGDIVPVRYTLLFTFWPVAAVVGTWWLLKKPQMARQGRITLFIVLGSITLPILGDAIVTVLWALDC